jgi:hypothetical protein
MLFRHIHKNNNLLFIQFSWSRSFNSFILNNNNKSNGITDDSLNDLIKKSKVMNSSSILKTYNIDNTLIS